MLPRYGTNTHLNSRLNSAFFVDYRQFFFPRHNGRFQTFIHLLSLFLPGAEGGFKHSQFMLTYFAGNDDAQILGMIVFTMKAQ